MRALLIVATQGTHATLLPAPLGKNIKSNALNYQTCSEACCGQLAWHYDAIEDQKTEKSEDKSFTVLITL